MAPSRCVSITSILLFTGFLSVIYIIYMPSPISEKLLKSSLHVRPTASVLKSSEPLLGSLRLANLTENVRMSNITAGPISTNYTRILVVPQTSKDSTAWIDEKLLNIEVALYHVDDPTATPQPPLNKGHEVMVYLTYIIDHYHDLPDIIIFLHAHRQAWHNTDLLGFDAVEMVNRLSAERVTRQGYMNLRCGWDPGCPEWLHPYDDALLIGKQEQVLLAKVWPELFPLDPLPEILAQPCCAQFAVSRERVLSIPQERFVFYRDWVLRTPLTDYYSGRVWEFIWQYVFTGRGVFCPPEHACYCDGYGVCFGGETAYKEFFEMRKTKQKYSSELDSLLKNQSLGQEEGMTSDTAANNNMEGTGLEREHFLRDRIEALNKELTERRLDALEKGSNAANRALEAGSS